jgi:hypothetical protein
VLLEIQGLLLGRRVRKYFEDHGWFLGTVVSYDRDYYRVVYEDSDSKEYSELELSKIMFRSGDCQVDGVNDSEQTQKQGAAEQVATGKKRDLQPNHNVGTAVLKIFTRSDAVGGVAKYFKGLRLVRWTNCFHSEMHIYVIVYSDSDQEEYRFDDSELGSVVRATEEDTDNMYRKTHNPADHDETIFNMCRTRRASMQCLTLS